VLQSGKDLLGTSVENVVISIGNEGERMLPPVAMGKGGGQGDVSTFNRPEERQLTLQMMRQKKSLGLVRREWNKGAVPFIRVKSARRPL